MYGAPFISFSFAYLLAAVLPMKGAWDVGNDNEQQKYGLCIV